MRDLPPGEREFVYAAMRHILNEERGWSAEQLRAITEATRAARQRGQGR